MAKGKNVKPSTTVLDRKELFLAELPQDLRPIVEARMKRKQQELEESKKRAKSVAEVTKALMEDSYITFDDGSDITFGELLTARATANLMKSEKTTFRDINDMQKVIENDTKNNTGGFTLVINTNGQDLGV